MKSSVRGRLERWRRTSLAAVAVIAVLGVVAACSSSGNGSGNGKNSSSPGASSGPAADSATRTLRVLLNSPPSGLDPIVSARDGEYVWGTMLDALVSTDANLDPGKDGIVTDWSRPNPTTWTLTIRPGLKFTDGEAADASAVAYSILQNRDNPAGILKSYFANVKSVVATNATTVTVTTDKPQYDLINLLCTVYLIPPKYYQEQGTKGFTAHPIGTGAFVWKGEQPGQSISVTANPDYWGGKPKIGGITFTWASDSTQRLALIQSGAQDVSFDLPPAQAASARSAGLDVVTLDTAVKLTAFLEADKAPFNNPTLREAAALAVDRNALVSSILEGGATPDGGLLNVKPDQKPAQEVQADPAKAKSLVTGSPQIQLTWPSGKYTDIDDVAKAVGGQLEAAGFKVKYNPTDYGSEVGLIVQGQITGMYILAAVPNVAVPDFFAHGFLTSNSITKNCPDPQMDTLAEQALTADGPDQAAPIYDQLNTMAVVQQHCYIPLYQQKFSYALKNVGGIDYNALNNVLFNDAYFTK